MLSIQELIKQKIDDLGKKEKHLNQRQALVKELYEVYLLENKVENYCRYLHWLKKEKKPKTKETVEEFKKVKLPIEKKYIEPNKVARFAFRLSHIETPDLYYLISQKNDFKHRNKYQRSAFTKWLFYSIRGSNLTPR